MSKCCQLTHFKFYAQLSRGAKSTNNFYWVRFRFTSGSEPDRGNTNPYARARPAPPRRPPPATHARTAPSPPVLANARNFAASMDSAHTHRTPPAIPPPPPAPWRSFAGGKWAVTCSAVRRRAAPLANGASGCVSGDSVRIIPAPVRACTALPPQARPTPRLPASRLHVRPAPHLSPVPSARGVAHQQRDGRRHRLRGSGPQDTRSSAGADVSADKAGRRKREMREAWVQRIPARGRRRWWGADGGGGRGEGASGKRDEGSPREETIQKRGGAGRDRRLDSQRTARPARTIPRASAQRCTETRGENAARRPRVGDDVHQRAMAGRRHRRCKHESLPKRTHKVVKRDAPVVPTHRIEQNLNICQEAS
ncbi:hypothetical protein FB451DRAFT_1191622 [Mycena latifolia]|nr:hypothetical protein FB451DRAFT_1191622 [Mycena latifolia]